MFRDTNFLLYLKMISFQFILSPIVWFERLSFGLYLRIGIYLGAQQNRSCETIQLTAKTRVFSDFFLKFRHRKKIIM